MAETKSVYETLRAVDVNSKVEQKNGLNYLSWAWAWDELKKVYPDANYTVYENNDGWNYHTDGKTCWVKCGVTVNGLEHIETLAVMDFRSQSIPFANVKSTDVIKTIQRCVTKAIGRHGLGINVYAGEDLPEEEPKQTQEVQRKEPPKQHTEDKELNKLKATVMEAINRGDLQGKALARAKQVMATNDKEGLKGCLDYLQNKEVKKTA